ncbi:MAG: hypothetical protein JWL77_3936 [Chthonomonadaceae bacterium]|nr:hypothetical protein [Chthonomonadaceae bacterium]
MKIKGMVAFALMLTAFTGIGRTAQAQTTPQADAAALNHLIHAAWQQKGVVPAKPVDDARYLRRIYLDITGTIPPEQVVSEFLTDRSPDKRAKAVDALLDSSAYADHWATYWDNVLMGKPAPMATVDYGAFRRWLHGEFAQNAPYNRFVADLITASGFNTTGVTYAESMGYGMAQPAAAVDPDRPKIDPSTVNGAVNWHLRFAANPADVAGIASKIFLGVQIQCAQCHDHKTEKWKQTDFRSFTACFIQTVGIPAQRYTAGQAMKGILPLNVRDVNFIVRGNKMNGGDERLPYVEATPVALDGTRINVVRSGRRKELAAWMTSPQNPWFAQAIVNRMWAKFLGRGFVEPIDDFRPSNPAILPEAMQVLAKDFAAHNYDMKTLIKTICASDVYQRSSVPASSKADPENSLWGHYRLKPMEVNEIVSSLITATNFQPVLNRVAGGNADQLTSRLQRLLTFTFTTDEPESEQKDFEGTIPQALLLLNNGLTNGTISPIPGSALADVLAMPGGDEEKITSLYLRTLSRRPTAAEITHWTGFLAMPREVVIARPSDLPRPSARPNLGMVGKPGQQGMGMMGGPQAGADPLLRIAVMRNQFNRPTPKQQAYEDMFWALLNSSEFIFNH